MPYVYHMCWAGSLLLVSVSNVLCEYVYRPSCEEQIGRSCKCYIIWAICWHPTFIDRSMCFVVPCTSSSRLCKIQIACCSSSLDLLSYLFKYLGVTIIIWSEDWLLFYSNVVFVCHVILNFLHSQIWYWIANVNCHSPVCSMCPFCPLCKVFVSRIKYLH